MALFKIVYWLGVVAEIAIRAPINTARAALHATDRRVSFSEKAILASLGISGIVFPLIYTGTRWLSFADYGLPIWMGWLGVPLMVLALFIFSHAHSDLKSSWSPSLEIFDGHTLVTSGIYAHIRHPMYASQLVFATAQLLLLQNWIAGPLALIAFIPSYLARVRAEEKMMLDAFGDQYRDYASRTGAILPRFR